MHILPGGFVDPKRHTLKDLARHHPEGKNTFKRKILDKKKEIKALSEETELSRETEAVNDPQEPASPSVKMAPQVRINENGEIVIDEASLKMKQAQELEEVYEEDKFLKKLNSCSFRKKGPLIRQVPWSKLETEMFYEVLRSVGSDFSLMEEYIPNRESYDLKAKFNKEERANPARIDDCMKRPRFMDDGEIQRIVNHYQYLIDREKQAKEEGKQAQAEELARLKTRNQQNPVEVEPNEHAQVALQAGPSTTKVQRRAMRKRTKRASESSVNDEVYYSGGVKVDQRPEFKRVTRRSAKMNEVAS